jgi:hypothetical protein
MIDENEFKVISSVIGTGAFCVMTGKINSNNGNVTVEIHKVFRILLSIILCFPLIPTVAVLLTDTNEFSPVLILLVIGQVLMIRYVLSDSHLSFYQKQA